MWNREPSPGVKKCNNPTGRHRSLGAVQVKTDDSRPGLASLSFFICSIATIWNRRVSRGFESEAVGASEGVMTNQQEGQADGRYGRQDMSTVAGGFGIGIAIPLVAALTASVGMYVSSAVIRPGPCFSPSTRGCSATGPATESRHGRGRYHHCAYTGRRQV